MSPRLFLQIATLEARTRMAYRIDFWINAILGFVIELGVAWFLWDAMFRESGQKEIGGYDKAGMTLYYVAVILIGRLVRGPILGGEVSQDIYEGGLNRYLVFPTSYFGFKYAQAVGSLLPALLQFLLLGGVFVVALESGAGVTPLTLLMALVSIFAANLLYFALGFPLQTIAFWADNVWSLTVALRFTAGLLGGALLPLTVFPPRARALLDWLPFHLLYDLPVGVLTGRIGAGEWLRGLALALLWTSILALLGRLVWRRGILQYSGVGI